MNCEVFILKTILVLTLTMALTLSLSGCAGEADYKKGYEDAIKKMEAEHAEAYNTGYSYGFDAGYEAGLEDGKPDDYSKDSSDVQEHSSGYNGRLAIYQSATKESKSYTNPVSDYGIDDETFDIVLEHIHEHPHKYYLYDEQDIESYQYETSRTHEYDLEEAYQRGYEDGFEDAR